MNGIILVNDVFDGLFLIHKLLWGQDDDLIDEIFSKKNLEICFFSRLLAANSMATLQNRQILRLWLTMIGIILVNDVLRGLFLIQKNDSSKEFQYFSKFCYILTQQALCFCLFWLRTESVTSQ